MFHLRVDHNKIAAEIHQVEEQLNGSSRPASTENNVVVISRTNHRSNLLPIEELVRDYAEILT